MSNEKTLDGFLGDKLKIFQLKNGYRAGHDAVILASSIKAKKGDNCLELGLGSGVVSICLAHRVAGIKILGFENNPSMLEISNENIKINNFQKIIKVLNIDIEGKLNKVDKLKSQTFDHVYANPPYFTKSTSSIPENDNKKAANIGNNKTLEIWIRKSLTFSKSGGTITFINHINNLPELLYLFSKKMGGVEVTPIYPKRNTPASRVIVTGVRDSKKAMKFNEGLILNNSNGKPTRRVENILRKGVSLLG